MTDLLFDDKKDKWETKTCRNDDYAQLRVDIFKYINELYYMFERKAQLITTDILEIVAKNINKGEKTMGRAIDMEKDIDILKSEVKELKGVLNKILEGVNDDKKETKKTNTKRSKTSSGKSDARPESSEQQS